MLEEGSDNQICKKHSTRHLVGPQYNAPLSNELLKPSFYGY